MEVRSKFMEGKKKVVGVSWDAKNGKWVAQICHKQKRYNLGRYESFEEAVAARKRAEEDVAGKIAAAEDMNKLKKARLGKKLTQKELAELSGVSLQNIKKWEAGINKPKASSLEGVARVLGVSVDELV
jgi:DNA-binding transcriptional regulator YiaG